MKRQFKCLIETFHVVVIANLHPLVDKNVKEVLKIKLTLLGIFLQLWY